MNADSDFAAGRRIRRLRAGRISFVFGTITAVFNRGDLRTCHGMRMIQQRCHTPLEGDDRLPSDKGTCGDDGLHELITGFFRDARHGFFLCDASGRLSSVNKAFLEQTGLAGADFPGVDLADLLIEEHRERFRRFRDEILHSDGLTSFCELAFARENGEPCWLAIEGLKVERRRQAVLIMGISHDLTATRQREQALREGEARYRALINASLNAAFLLDTEGRILAANEEGACRLGHQPEELIGRRIESLLPPAVARLRREKGLQAIREGAPVRFEDEVDGVVLEHLIFPLRGEDGAVSALASYSVNVTDRRTSEEERKRLQTQLRQAQKMEAIGTLAGGIAHDFNNLMMAIQGNVSLMLMKMDPAHPHYESLKNIERGIRSGADLTAKLLGYARKGKYEVRPVDLNALILEISDTFARMRKDIVIKRELTTDLKGILADKGQLEQVLLNLFVNAADAMPQGGTLSIKTLPVTHESIPSGSYRPSPGPYVQLAVGDTGVGMPPEVQERIFDPFFTTKKMGRGTGLGLASAYGIIKSHNGYVEVDSKVGSGTTFYIYLPASPGKPAATTEAVGVCRSGSGTLLLVDDEENVLMVTAQMLSRSGFTVIEARSGRDAIRLYSQNQDKIDLIILDMVMPEMGGGDVFDRIRSINPSAKVLLASGYSLEGQAREIMKRGCDGFIQKPFTLEELVGKIQTVIECG